MHQFTSGYIFVRSPDYAVTIGKSEAAPVPSHDPRIRKVVEENLPEHRPGGLLLSDSKNPSVPSFYGPRLQQKQKHAVLIMTSPASFTWWLCITDVDHSYIIMLNTFPIAF